MRYYNSEDHFNRYFMMALLGHIGLVILFYILQVVLKMNILDFRDPPKELNVIQSAVRVDVVGMPKYTLKELENVNLDQTAKEEEQPTEPVKPVEVKDQNTFKEKGKKLDFKNMLVNYSKKKIPKAKDKPKKLNQTALRKLVLEGNKVSAGTSFKGDLLDRRNQAFNSFVQSLPDQVRPHWKLPSYLAQKNLQCRIRIFISDRGKILRTEILESSGETEYDLKALQAIKKASPVSVPPKEIFARVSGGDVVLGFPL